MFMHKTLAFLASRVLMAIGGSARDATLFNEKFQKSSDGPDNWNRNNPRGPLLPHHRAHGSLTRRPGGLSQHV